MSHQVCLKKGLLRWYYIIKSRNGEITTVSQKYFSKSNAKKSAKTMAKALKAKYIDA